MRQATTNLRNRPPARPPPPPLQVTVASVEDDGLTVTCSRQVKIVADCGIAACAGQSYDLIALPVSTVHRAERNCCTWRLLLLLLLLLSTDITQ